jgi:hypothetical protein
MREISRTVQRKDPIQDEGMFFTLLGDGHENHVAKWGRLKGEST